MPLKKIILNVELDEQIEEDLFAVHSPSEDYFLAFQLNKTLGIQFKNVTETIESQAMVPFFSRFIWEKSPGELRWELIANHYVTATKDNRTNQLFDTSFEKKTSLIPSLQKVDYFIKAPKNVLDREKVKTLQSLNEIQLIYSINDTKIKQNPNLIFD